MTEPSRTVPREPTQAMLKAIDGFGVSPAHPHLGLSEYVAAAAWRAMYDAAPASDDLLSQARAANRDLDAAREERDEAVRRMNEGWIQVCQTPIKDCLERAEQAEERARALRTTLTELVACDDIVKAGGAKKVRRGRWSAAWAAARAALAEPGGAK